MPVFFEPTFSTHDSHVSHVMYRKNLMLARGANALDKFSPTRASFAPEAADPPVVVTLFPSVRAQFSCHISTIRRLRSDGTCLTNLKAVAGCEFIHYLADENQWTDWGHELGILSRHKCLGITYLLRRRVGRIPSVRRRRRPLDQGRDALFIGIASELLRIRIESRHA